MFKNLKWLRIVPDQPGKGGQKSGFHSFQAQPVNDTLYCLGFHLYRGRWRRDYKSQPVLGITHDSGSLIALSLHSYTYPSLTDPSAQPGLTLLGHNLGPATSRYWDYTNGTTRDVHGIASVPATFLNIQGRCFVADGAREGMILDDRTPAIHAQKNQNLGIGTPTQPPSNYFGNLTPYGTGYCYNGSRYVTHPNAANMIGSILATDVVSFSTLNTSYGQYAGVTIVQASPVADAVSSDQTAFTATGTISITTGTSLVTLAGATWPANFGYCGLAINFSGYSFVIAEHGVQANAYNIDGTQTGWAGAPALSNVQLLILGVYDGPTLTNVPYSITGCRFEMPGANPASSLTISNTGTLGYSQTTASNLVQVQILAIQGGLFRNLGNISLGPSIDEEAATGVIQYVTDAAMPSNRPKVTSASLPFTDADVDAPCGMDGASSSGGLLITTIKTFVDPGTVRLAVSNTSGGALAGKQFWWGADPVISDGAVVNGTNTLTSASNPFIAGDVGQTIVIEGAGAGGIALIRKISVYNTPGNITFDGAAAATGVTNTHVWWRGISTSTHAGPTYSYAWYDPETGHMSNIAPLYEIPRPTQIGDYTDFANVTPVFQIDPGYISYPSGVDALRFSHIMFFRTLSTPGSSTLYPIGSVMPYVGKVHPGSASTRGSWSPSTYHGWIGIPNNYASVPPETMGTAPNLWYDFSSDEDLILTGGFRAPQFTNSKPMALLSGGITQPAKVAYQAYWDRRLWVTSTQEPDKVAFSCDEAQCPLGIPVESFPPTNFLRIPSVDGKVVGMKSVGDMLLITTERWAYTVAGNNESNYRLLRVSTRMGGVGTYQMSELTSDVEGQSSIVYFLGRDKIVYEWVPGNTVTPISDPIQDFLNVKIHTLADYTSSRVHCVSAWARRLVIVTCQNASQNNATLVFDVNNRVWTLQSPDDGTLPYLVPPPAMTTIYGLDPPVNEIFAAKSLTLNEIELMSWIRDDGAVTNVPNLISTFPLDFDGKKTRKQLAMVNIHCTASTGVWSLAVAANEANYKFSAFAAYPDPLESIYGPTAPNPVDGFDSKDLVVMTAAFDTTNAAIVGYRFVLRIQTTTTDLPTSLYAIDIGYTEWEEPGDGDP